MRIIISSLIFFSFNLLYAKDFGTETGFKLPRYVSIKSDEANLRVGPSQNYPIILKYVKKNLPVIIIEEYKVWRKIKDIYNNVGWIHKRLLTGSRNGIIISNNQNRVYVMNTSEGITIGEIEVDNIISILKCKMNSCLIKYQNYKGWVNKNNLWGVDQSEIFNLGYTQLFIDTYWYLNNLLLSYLKKYDIINSNL